MSEGTQPILSPENKEKFDKLFAELFQPDANGHPSRPVASLASNERMLRISTVRDAMKVGYRPTSELLRYILDCTTTDRTERISAAKSEKKSAKAFTGIPSAEEL